MRYFLTTALFLLITVTRPAIGATDNFNPRSMTWGDIVTFAPLACSGNITGNKNSEEVHCQGLSGYPGESSGPYDITFTSIIVGHLTNINAIQAFVSYTGNFESHADDYGGGILFQAVAGRWILAGWFPSVIMDDCIQLNPVGQARLLCHEGHEGMGEITSSLWLWTIPSTYDATNSYSADSLPVLRAQDDRKADDPNYDCSLIKRPNDKFPLSVGVPEASDKPGFVAVAQILYVDPTAAASFCARHDFADARVTQENIRFAWDGKTLTMSPYYSFAKTDY